MNELNLGDNNEDQQESMEIVKQSTDTVDLSTAKILTTNNMNAALMHLYKILAIMEEFDPNEGRISQLRREIEKDTAFYREIYNEESRNDEIQST
ncbi:hypothetical protein HZS_7839 [Henneguya salminicola]|nr:hypothetical protein HZS_7839 [Henneguya salminicola]